MRDATPVRGAVRVPGTSQRLRRAASGCPSLPVPGSLAGCGNDRRRRDRSLAGTPGGGPVSVRRMTFRDDGHARHLRMEALERELRDAREEIEALRRTSGVPPRRSVREIVFVGVVVVACALAL